MKTHVRVVVIGGGAMGCSLLYHLTKLGWTDVALVEKHELTAGSTWHAAGLCTHFAHSLTVMHMRAYSVRLYSSLLEADTGVPVSFHRTGALRVTRSSDRVDEFRHVQGIGKFAGLDFHVLPPENLKELHPLARPDGLLGIFHEPNDGHVDPSQATQAMEAGARARGAAIYRHNPVEAIRRCPSGEWIVHTRDGDIRADHIVNAAGTWAYEIGRMMGVELPVVPMLHQYLVTGPIAAVTTLGRELPIIRDPEKSWYVRQERDGLILGPYERGGKPWSIDGVPPEFGMELLPPDLDAVEPIIMAAIDRIPALGDGGIRTVVNGPITFTPDAGPLIGPVFGVDRAWLLTGSSMGVMESGGAGKFLAEWMMGGEPPMDALAVDPRRFGGFADRNYRIAKAIECFENQFAIHFPYEERGAGRPKWTTPIYHRLARLGAVFGFAYGTERPNWFARPGRSQTRLTFRRPEWFAAVREECLAVRDRVGLAEMSVLSKFEVSGRGAEAFLERLGANRPPSRVGRIGLIHALTPSGGILSEFTVTRLAVDRYYLTSAAAARRQDYDLLRRNCGDFADVRVEEVTRRMAVLAIMGPRSREVLASLADRDVSNEDLPWLSGCELTIAGIPVRLLRVSYVGELGYELHHAMENEEALFEALMGAGRRFDIHHFGAFAINSMRLEKGYRAWGIDYTTERTPFEAGIEPLVKLDGRRFIGRKALEEHASRPARKRMVLMGIDSEGPDPFFNHPVLRDGRVVGIVTSGAFGHRTGLKLALAYLEEAAAAEHNGFVVEILGQPLPAVILSRPPYDPENRRLRG